MAVMKDNQNPNPSLSILPPGFKFHPSGEEILAHYLPNSQQQDTNQPKKHVSFLLTDLIPRVDVYNYHPSDLPMTHNRYYCITPQKKKKNKTRHSRKRKAKGGFWKSKGSSRTVPIEKDGVVLGTRRSFVFYQGVTGLPQDKTDWVLNEYVLADSNLQDSFSLCCVHLKPTSEKKVLKNLTTSIAQEILPTALHNNNADISYKHLCGVPPMPQVDELVGHNDTCDDLERLLLSFADESNDSCDARSVPNSLQCHLESPYRDQTEVSCSGILDDVIDNELIHPVFVEGDFLELDDLSSPLVVDDID